jgi:hypothetical protein
MMDSRYCFREALAFSVWMLTTSYGRPHQYLTIIHICIQKYTLLILTRESDLVTLRIAVIFFQPF